MTILHIITRINNIIVGIIIRYVYKCQRQAAAANRSSPSQGREGDGCHISRQLDTVGIKGSGSSSNSRSSNSSSSGRSTGGSGSSGRRRVVGVVVAVAVVVPAVVAVAATTDYAYKYLVPSMLLVPLRTLSTAIPLRVRI